MSEEPQTNQDVSPPSLYYHQQISNLDLTSFSKQLLKAVMCFANGFGAMVEYLRKTDPKFREVGASLDSSMGSMMSIGSSSSSSSSSSTSSVSIAVQQVVAPAPVAPCVPATPAAAPEVIQKEPIAQPTPAESTQEKVKKPRKSKKQTPAPAAPVAVEPAQAAVEPAAEPVAATTTTTTTAEPETAEAPAKPAHKTHTHRKRDPNRPKQPNNAYMIFSNEMRPKLKESMPDADFPAIFKEIGKRWGEMSDEQKAVSRLIVSIKI